MAKFYGSVGYAITEQTSQSVWEPKIVERQYKGDIFRRVSRWRAAEQLNDNKDVTQELSIVADSFAYNHFTDIRYVEWMGVKWKVESVTPQRPRLILSIGGIYNGEE